MAKQADNNTNAINLIAASTKIVGDVNTSNDIRIDGTLNGNLLTSGKLIIGLSGKVIGEINCKTSEIEGSIEGKINVIELLSLKSTSILKGEVTTGQIMIEPGAVFSGNCKMNNPTEKKQK